MMKKLLIATAFCLCLSLVATEGESEQEKEHWPNWEPTNLAIGPFNTAAGIMCFSPLYFLYVIGRADTPGDVALAMLKLPVLGSLYLIDGVIHTATFGLLYSCDKKTHEGHDYVLPPGETFDRLCQLTKRKKRRSISRSQKLEMLGNKGIEA